MEDLKFLYRENDGTEFYIVCQDMIDDAEILQVMDEMFALHAAAVSENMSLIQIRQQLVEIVDRAECCSEDEAHSECKDPHCKCACECDHHKH